jgi:hypothetical protein
MSESQDREPALGAGDTSEGRDRDVAAGAMEITRRDALVLLGAAPLIGVVDWTDAGVTRAARMVRALSGEAGDGVQASTPRYFVAHEWRTVRVLVDYIIPRDERSGSATDAKVPEFMDFILSDKDTSDNTRLAIRGGLAWLDTECRRRFGGKSFVDCGDAERRLVLDDIAWPGKARHDMSYGVSFFNRIRDMTASGFFSSAMGWKDLQYMGHVFVTEWKGCPPAALQKLGVSDDLMKTRVPVQR